MPGPPALPWALDPFCPLRTPPPTCLRQPTMCMDRSMCFKHVPPSRDALRARRFPETTWPRTGPCPPTGAGACSRRQLVESREQSRGQCDPGTADVKAIDEQHPTRLMSAAQTAVAGHGRVAITRRRCTSDDSLAGVAPPGPSAWYPWPYLSALQTGRMPRRSPKKDTSIGC